MGRYRKSAQFLSWFSDGTKGPLRERRRRCWLVVTNHLTGRLCASGPAVGVKGHANRNPDARLRGLGAALLTTGPASHQLPPRLILHTAA
jgi:hypothetical protein